MEEQWEELPAEEKRKLRRNRWLSPDKIPFASPEARQLFAERESRIDAAIRLEIPDRVPIWHHDLGFFPATYTGITFQEMIYNSDALVASFKKTIVDFQPDMYWNPPIPVPGEALAILNCKQLKWPGYNLPSNLPFQYVEGEYMRADEYDAFIDDPTDYILRTYLPRLLGTLEPFKKLPSLKNFLGGYFSVAAGSAFINPEVVTAFEEFFRAGVMIQNHQFALNSFHEDMRQLGFPLAFGATVVSPFDLISDTVRGMHGIMLDMYRQPDKILRAIEKVIPFQIESVLSRVNESGNPRAMIFVHRGSDCFMSAKQWETFYWPGCKKIIMALIDEGVTPLLFLEGDCTSRLAYFTELPKGRVLGLFDSTDMYKAKEILGDIMCISGMMPLSLLQTGSPKQVKAYAKKLIDVVGKGGGFIMGARSVLDEANPDLVRVWFDYSKEYGVYK